MNRPYDGDVGMGCRDGGVPVRGTLVRMGNTSEKTLWVLQWYTCSIRIIYFNAKKKVLMKEFLFLSNMAIIVLTPMFLCIYFGLFLVNQYNAPNYIVIFAILIGITSGVMSCVKLLFKKGGK